MTVRRRWGLLTLGAACLPLLLPACGDGSGSPAERQSEPGTTLEDEITVFAAASLTDGFEEIGAVFEADHPGVTVALNLGASSALREQVLEGAPADVFASANTANMDEVVEAGAASDPEVFATNRLQIAVPAGNPAGVTALADLGRGDLLVGLCAEEVPCGAFAREALAEADVTAAVDTNEPDVRSLLTKIAAGELDAGIVYLTDVRAAGDGVDGIDIPDDQNVTARYTIAPVAGGDTAVAAAFVDLVLSPEGQAILSSYGFGAP